MQHYTTIEQSKHLLELGLNPESADMVHIIKRKNCKEPWEKVAKDEGNVFTGLKDTISMCLSDYALPCWSLGALLELLEYPKVYKDRLGDEDVWFCKCYINDWREMHQSSAESTPIEAVYSMIVWLLEHRYLKKGE